MDSTLSVSTAITPTTTTASADTSPPSKGIARKKTNGTKPKTSARRRSTSAQKMTDENGDVSMQESSDDVYVAEKIVRHREHKRYLSYEYLIRWEGYGPEEDTWEPHENIIDSATVLVDEYWAPRGGYEANRLDLPAGSKHKSLDVSADLDPSNTLQKRLRRQTGSMSGSAPKMEVDSSEKAESPTPRAGTTRRQKSPAARSPSIKSPQVKSPPVKTNKRANPASAPAALPQASKLRSPVAVRPKADGDAWSPPLELTTWENQASIHSLERDDNNELYVFIQWPQDDQMSRHRANVVYQKMPQSMLKYYESNLVFKPYSG